jgi:hypothetical protein
MFIEAVFAMSIWFLGLGGILYLFEYAMGRVTMKTLWKDLDGHQLQSTVLVIIGVVMFIGSLIAGAVLKGM